MWVGVWVRIDWGRVERLKLANTKVSRRGPEPAADAVDIADVVLDADRPLAWVCGSHQCW
jgi:hypothetical protein